MLPTQVFEALFGRRALVRFRPSDWRDLIGELERRAGGVRESGAFLLARRLHASRTVAAVVYFDDLDPLALRGGIELGADAFARLWDRCRELDLRVIGDVHTHPSDLVCQSGIDRDNPMIAQAGHVALIVPNLAASVTNARGTGVHLYGGDRGWTSWCRGDGHTRIYIGRWA